MLYIQKMAETVKESGVSVQIQTVEDIMLTKLRESDGSYAKFTMAKSFNAQLRFWEAFAKNNVFVFSKINETTEHLLEDETMAKYQEFESPFSIFSIEMANGPITSSNPAESSQQVNIECIMVVDNAFSVDNYDGPPAKAVFSLYRAGHKNFVIMDLMFNEWTDSLDGSSTMSHIAFPNFDHGKNYVFRSNDWTSELVKRYTDRLNDNSIVGQEETHINIHYRGKHNSKEKAQIRRVVHIVPKKFRNSYKSSSGKEVEWTHRFWRRGTWVYFYTDDKKSSIDYGRIGKNRDGEYCEHGRTWRVESIVNKDREDLPLIQKTRIVKE